MRILSVFSMVAFLATVCGCGRDEAASSGPGASVAGAPVPDTPAGAAASASAADREALVEGVNRCAFDLYRELAAQSKGGNLFFSPLSASATLAMASGGARGGTAKEIRSALHLDLPADRLSAAMGGFVGDLNSAGKDGGFELCVANALWGQKGHEFLPEFLALNKAGYGAGLQTVDFAGDADGACRAINAWVGEQTRDRITGLFAPGSLDKTTRMVLTDAVYFKGGWRNVFEEGRTEPQPFKLGGGLTVQVPMMRQTDWFAFGASRGYKAVELPYMGGRLAMLVLLPEKGHELADLEMRLSVRMLKGLDLESHEVVLGLPRFRLETESRLDAALKSLGMAEAFDVRKADFSGIDGETSPDARLFLGAVVHKAFVDVNEKGTEAVAATGAAACKADGVPPEHFTADRPFVFLIRDRKTGIVLFLGRVTDPSGGSRPETPKSTE